jgi:hypothetical protein
MVHCDTIYGSGSCGLVFPSSIRQKAMTRSVSWEQTTGQTEEVVQLNVANYDGFVLTRSGDSLSSDYANISPTQVMAIPFWEEALLGSKGTKSIVPSLSDVMPMQV